MQSNYCEIVFFFFYFNFLKSRGDFGIGEAHRVKGSWLYLHPRAETMGCGKSVLKAVRTVKMFATA